MSARFRGWTASRSKTLGCHAILNAKLSSAQANSAPQQLLVALEVSGAVGTMLIAAVTGSAWLVRHGTAPFLWLMLLLRLLPFSVSSLLWDPPACESFRDCLSLTSQPLMFVPAFGMAGSAAFNLQVIIAVCVIAIPKSDTRRIEQMRVYCVTAFFSIAAYIWLIVILLWSSPNMIEPWEARALAKKASRAHCSRASKLIAQSPG